MFFCVVWLAGLATGLTPKAETISREVLLRTPPMGADLWYSYGWSWTEKDVRDNVDCAATNGLVELGWRYIMLTEGWQGVRSNGVLMPNPIRIADITNLVQYIHSRGMKAGIYTEPRVRTSAGFPGSEGYLEEDASAFAAWGIDYVQFDMPQAITDAERLEVARRFVGALRRATTRPIAVYSSGFKSLPAGASEVLDCIRWVGDLGFAPHPLFTFESRWTNYLHHLDRSAAHPDAVRPGFWVHPDHIPVNDQNLGFSQGIFGMNALIAAPLFVHRFVPRVSYPNLYSIFTNKEIIAINQDPLGYQARPIWTNGQAQVWMKILADGSRAIGLLNRSTKENVECIVNWTDIGLAADTLATVRDCWAHRDVDHTKRAYRRTVPAMQAAILKIIPRSSLQLARVTESEVHLDLHLPNHGNYTVESSSDLSVWSRLIVLTNQSGRLRLTNQESQGRQRFYRNFHLP
ncbi:MAG: hypothetical protein AB1813_06820 [Verrucomicrobiota bacterium]